MMTVHTASVIDNKTGKEIVMENCSYNQATFFLAHTFPRESFIGVAKGLGDTIYIRYKERDFWYDETRGLLLGA